MIHLYAETHWDSPFVFSVFVALHEKQVAYEEHALNLQSGEQHEAAFARRSITARVPTIEHDGFWLAESSAIIEYLDECFPPSDYVPLLPTETRERARARQVLAWLRSDLNALRADRPTTTMFFERASLPLSKDGRRDAEKLQRVTCDLLGDRQTLFSTWSMADADLAFMIQRLVLNGDPVSAPVREFADRQWARPSVQAYLVHPRSP